LAAGYGTGVPSRAGIGLESSPVESQCPVFDVGGYDIELIK